MTTLPHHGSLGLRSCCAAVVLLLAACGGGGAGDDDDGGVSFADDPMLKSTGFTTFESGPVRPLALSADARTLLATNTPDNRLEIHDLSGAAPAATDGNVATFTCAPPGSGARIGVDRDADGILDGDDI